MVKLTNSTITAEIAALGAELQSLKLNGAEYLWNGDPAYWTGRAPVLFPICGGVADDTYTYGGKKYRLPKHGFARKREFTLESASDNAATFLLRSDDDTRGGYPFEFELRARYALYGATLVADYMATNTGECDMLFSVGAHEGYACPEGIAAYDLVFERPENLRANVLHGNLLGRDTIPVLEGDTLALDPRYFEVDALVFTDVKSRKVTLRNRATGRSVEVRFDGFPYLLIWQKHNAPYICIEPWCGLPDYIDGDGTLAGKAGIITAAPGETIVRTHTVRLM